MKILVVGGAGYIGSVCSELLLNQGHEVAVFDSLSEGHRAAVDPRALFIEGDLADRPSIASAFSRTRPEAVMHFAASALVGESMQNPSKYFRNNVANGLNLLDAMVEAKCCDSSFHRPAPSSVRRSGCLSMRRYRKIRLTRTANRSCSSKKSCAGTSRSTD